MPLSPGTRLGPYEIAELIGAGGMGEVYRAKDTRLDRTVAVKVLPAQLAENPEFRQRFEREARAVSSLNHPHICTLYDIGRQDGVDFLVMEYLEGETVAARLTGGALPPDLVLRYAIQVADALDKAHRQGLTHRDLKPGNIMLTKAGAKLLDFGLAKMGVGSRVLGVGETRLSMLPTQVGELTQKGTILGTFQYMAPEQLQGQEADARSDIFAFGAVLYEMATGQKAFAGKNQPAIVAAILGADPPPIVAQPALDRLVQRCLAKDPDDRWQSARDLMLELKAAAEPTETPPSPKTHHPSPTLPWAIAALAVAALVLFALLRPPAPEQRVVKLQILPPEKSAFDTVLISPDGRRLAFAAPDAVGKTVLWVRPLEALSAQPLAGTDGAVFPFWSADSRSLGFFAGGKLKKIEASGGPAQTVCDAPQGRAGAWNRDGVILFLPVINGPLQRVSAAGGEAKPATTLDASRQETSHRWPHFLPDGRRFLYLGRSGQREKSGIYLASLDSPDRKLVGAADSSMAYARSPERGPGYLLFLRERTLMAQPFDDSRGQTAGDAFPVAEQVGNEANSARGHFSTSETGVLVYDAAGGAGFTQPLWFDRAGKSLGPVGPPGAYFGLNLSPDEKRLAAGRADSGNIDIWLSELSRDITSRFTFDPASDFSPIWSPDGNRIVFLSIRDGVGNLYQKASSGAGADELLLKTGGNKRPTDWSRDGRFLLYEETDPKNANDLWVLPLEGERKPVAFLRTPFDEVGGQFSPDGKWIAYTSNESGKEEVYVQPLTQGPGAGGREPGGKWQVSTGGGGQPRWRRDGKELYYLAPDRKLMAVDVRAAATFEAARPQPLFETRAVQFTRYAVTANGQRFLMNLPIEAPAAVPATVVLNWMAGVKLKE